MPAVQLTTQRCDAGLAAHQWRRQDSAQLRGRQWIDWTAAAAPDNRPISLYTKFEQATTPQSLSDFAHLKASWNKPIKLSQVDDEHAPQSPVPEPSVWISNRRAVQHSPSFTAAAATLMVPWRIFATTNMLGGCFCSVDSITPIMTNCGILSKNCAIINNTYIWLCWTAMLLRGPLMWQAY